MKDLNEAKERGWEVAPHVTVRKGDHVLQGTHEEVVKRIAELERAEALKAEQSAAHALANSPITALVRRIRACAREYGHQWDTYADKDRHHSTRMTALDAATEQLGKLNETFEEILRQPKEALLANPDFRELQERLPT
jgi:hypothetical protein